jgi:dihydrofolate synthase/folylpolyglutamate synthase
MLADKDYEYCIGSLAKRADTFIAVTPENPRALAAEKTAAVASRDCGDAKAFSSLDEAINVAIVTACSDGAVISCGSLYLIGHIREIYMRKYKKR